MTREDRVHVARLQLCAVGTDVVLKWRQCCERGKTNEGSAPSGQTRHRHYRLADKRKE